MRKLHRFGLAGSILNVIAFYLRNRVQQGKTGYYLPEDLAKTKDAPQGSVLGPCSFLHSKTMAPEFCTFYPFLLMTKDQLVKTLLN